MKATQMMPIVWTVLRSRCEVRKHLTFKKSYLKDLVLMEDGVGIRSNYFYY